MAHALQIDTLAFTKKLREAGAEEGLAEAIVEGLTAADTSELATKSDLAEVKSEIKTDILKVGNKIVEVKAELKTDIAEVKSELKQDIAELKIDIAEVKSELKQDIAELKTEISQSANKAIYTLGGLVTVLFVLDRIIPLFGIAN